MKINAAVPEILSFFMPCFLLPYQILAPTLPTMQLDRQQLGQRFGCVMLVVANVASSRDEERATDVW